MHNPVDYIGAWRISERALIVIEWVNIVLRSNDYFLSLVAQRLFYVPEFFLRGLECLKKLVEIDIVDHAKVLRP